MRCRLRGRRAFFKVPARRKLELARAFFARRPPQDGWAPLGERRGNCGISCAGRRLWANDVGRSGDFGLRWGEVFGAFGRFGVGAGVVLLVKIVSFGDKRLKLDSF